MNLSDLKESQIKYIMNDSLNYIYDDKTLVLPGTNPLDIMYYCPVTKLILLSGNENFGYKHIYERHSSGKVYLTESNKRENQNIFTDIVPFQYMDVSINIFKTSIPVQKDNKLIYESYYRNCEYILVTDLNNIIISLYPKNTNPNKSLIYSKKALKYQTIKTATIFKPELNYKECSILFKKNSDQIVYSLTFIHENGTESWIFKDILTKKDYNIFSKKKESGLFDFILVRLSNDELYSILSTYIKLKDSSQTHKFETELKKIFF